MFPSFPPRRIAETLLDLADALLRPLPEETEARSAEDAGAQGVPDWELHPHRRSARIPRDRRPGATPAPTHHCIVPLPPRKPAARRTPSRA